jgi:hypothetical protein
VLDVPLGGLDVETRSRGQNKGMGGLPSFCITQFRHYLLSLNLSYIYLGYFVCVSVIHNCGTLCYSFSFSNQTDQGDETVGLEKEGLRWRDRRC